jgi:La-related protein 7
MKSSDLTGLVCNSAFVTGIDISLFLRFNKIRALTTDMKDICGALRNSELLSVTEDGTKVFRTTPVKEKENTDDCTIYVVSVVLP